MGKRYRWTEEDLRRIRPAYAIQEQPDGAKAPPRKKQSATQKRARLAEEGSQATFEASLVLADELHTHFPGVFIPEYYHAGLETTFDFADPKTRTALMVGHAWFWGREIGWTVTVFAPAEILRTPEAVLRRIKTLRQSRGKERVAG